MIRKYAEGCYRLDGRTVTEEDFDVLREAAADTKLKRARICVHRSDADLKQEMFVLLLRETYKGTYKYSHDNSIIILEGVMNVDFVDDKGKSIATEQLNPHQPFIKIEANTYHRPTLLTDYVLLHETHEGPWDKTFLRHMEYVEGLSG